MEGVRERNINAQELHRLVASHMPTTGDLTGNPGMYPDLELNQQPFSLQDDVQPAEPHQSEQ